MQSGNLFYFRDGSATAADVKGVLCVEGALITAKPSLDDPGYANNFRLVLQLDPQCAAVTKHAVYTLATKTAAQQVRRLHEPTVMELTGST